ncbi:DUF6177 family protein [Actinomadura sp. 9N215]|uniref:DUF6177 family protein n=1 Tax=Actinomadura sp. 9N215 TaxID=3375150 RepID=UPI0037B9169E
MTAYQGIGRPDLTYAPVWTGAPSPIGLAVGPSGVAEMGLTHALAAPVPGRVIGASGAPALWYRLAGEPGVPIWPRFTKLMRHLTATTTSGGIGTATPLVERREPGG